MSNHYVTNADFLKAINEYKEQVKHAEEHKLPKPKVSNYIGDCLLKIANHLSHKHNFINYTYKDEMVSDGVENCLMYITNFDSTKSNNPFAYFTQIIWYAFIRRIQKENKQTLIKGKIIVDMPFEVMETQEQDDDSSYINSYTHQLQNSGLFDDAVMKQKNKKKKKKVEIDSQFLQEISDE